MKILVLGATGLLGTEISRKLSENNWNLLLLGKGDLDLTNRAAIHKYLTKHKPDAIVLAAAMVGGLYANKLNPAKFFSENIQIYVNTLDAAAKNRIKNLIFISSAVMYPEKTSTRLNESSIFSGPLNTDTQYFGMAKLSGAKLIQAYRKENNFKWTTLVFPNLYGIEDNLNLDNNHVIPSLIQRISKAKFNNDNYILIKGDGSTRREFLNAKDAANAVNLILEKSFYKYNILNAGYGKSTSIDELATIIARNLNYSGEIKFETNTAIKKNRILDSSILRKEGWRPTISLEFGIAEVCNIWKHRKYI
jgi:GDP-L-fucose synthase